jgi:hypothetical protein
VRHRELRAWGLDVRFTFPKALHKPPSTFLAEPERLTGLSSPAPAGVSRSALASRFVFTAVATWTFPANGPFCRESLPYPHLGGRGDL